MMIISGCLREVRIPLTVQFKQSNNAGSARSLSAVVELTTDDGVTGYGEACPRTYVTGETMQSMQHDIQSVWQQLCVAPPSTIIELKRQTAFWKENGMGSSSCSALEQALMDIIAKRTRQSILELLDIHFVKPLTYSLVLPLSSVAGLEKLLTRLQQFVPPAIKIKVDQDIENALERIRLLNTIWPQVPIRVDINGAWSGAEAEQAIPRFLAAGVRSFEEPVAAVNLAALTRLTKTYGRDALIMADESLTGLSQAKQLIAAGAGNHFNIKISKVGGIFAAQRIYELAETHGIGCQLGAHFGETSLLTRSGLVFAGLVKGTLSNMEGAFGDLLLEKDLFRASVTHQHDGRLDAASAFQGFGFSDGLMEERLDTYSITTYPFV